MLGIPASHVLNMPVLQLPHSRVLCTVRTSVTVTQPLCTASQVHTRHGPTIQAGKVVMASFMPLVANLAVVSRQV